MKRILVTGFEPFAQFTENPSQDIARVLGGHIRGISVESLTVPYRSRREEIQHNLVDRLANYSFVLMFGQSFSSEPVLTIEHRAYNFVDYAVDNLYDNAGHRPPTGKIIEDAPDILESPIDTSELLNVIEVKEYPAQIGASQGYNFCNQTYFLALHAGTPALFVHLPPYPNQVDKGGLRWERQKGAGDAIIQYIIDGVKIRY